MTTNKTLQYIFSAIFGVAAFMFWWLLYPGLLGMQEQNQLFLFTSDYFLERIAVAGGLADYIAEFLTQFNYIPYLGEALMALLLVIFQRSIARLIARDDWYMLSFIVPVMMLIYMGNIYVMLSYLVALMIAVQLCTLYISRPRALFAGIVTLLGYWLIGPAVFVFTLYAAVKERNFKSLILIFLAALVVVVSKVTYMEQYPWKTVIFGVNYYRMALTVPVMQIVIALTTVLLPSVSVLLPKSKSYANLVLGALILAAGPLALYITYQKDGIEIIMYDQLVRHEDWDTILKRAQKYQPDSELGAVSINLALFMSGRGAELSKFKQFGTRGLILPNIRDFISNSSSSEVFWRLGMINESLRYAFDSQESLVNNRKSGRWMSRIAQCQILNGRYEAAEKYLNILSHSLFYRRWANDQRKYLWNDEVIMSDPVYAYLRTVRYQDDFLYYYPEMDKMLARLYIQNQNNVLAAWYYKAWTSLKTNETHEENTYIGGGHGN